MDKSALIPLVKAAQHPASEVGELTLQLAKLQDRGVPIAPTAVIPQSALEKIAEQTQLAEKLRRIIDYNPKEKAHQSKLLQKLKKAIKQTQLPNEIVHQVQLWYSQHPGFVKVFTDNHSHSYENIKGDVNLIESILNAWAQQIQLDFDNHQLRLFAQPILIQRQGEPTSSGISLTQSPHHKSRLKILSVFGVYDPHHPEIIPDEFEIDVRTKQIVSQQLNHQYLQLQRRIDHLEEKTIRHYQQQNYSLSKEQLEELAHFVITIKRMFLGDHQVYWYFQDGRFFITRIELSSKTTTPQATIGRVLLTGDSLQPGMVSGTIFSLTHKNQLGQISHGQVVIMNQLTPDYLPALSKAAAIICNHGLSTPNLTRHLIKYALPTIINTRHATNYLTPGLKVVVNAHTGQVMAADRKGRETAFGMQPTFTKTYISAGNPDKAKDYITPEVDGVGVFRSEYIFAKIGQHPKHLIRSRKRHQLKRELQQAIISYRQTKKNLPLIYRTLDLTSNEFKALEFASGFEPDEINPYLGFRGGIRTLNNFELLDLEVEVLQEIAGQNNVPLGLMLPFVRTPSELKLIQNHLATKHHFKLGSKIGLYLQLNTPQNIMQIQHYLSPALAGISLNAKSLHALIHGIDPDNPDIYPLYPYDREIMIQLLTQAAEAVKKYNSQLKNSVVGIKLILHLEDNNLRLVEIATRLGYNIITVKPEFAPQVKRRIQEIENEQLI